MTEKIVPPKSPQEEKLRDYYMMFLVGEDVVPQWIIDKFKKDCEEIKTQKATTL